MIPHSAGAGPLSGIRVIEICHMLAGPYCTMLLADLGAEVIKVETGEGDIARATGKHAIDGHNTYFASLNRNKKSVLLDLTDSESRKSFNALVANSHALVTNLRPRAIRNLGLTYDQLSGINPDLVCVALTGFGLNGPYSDLPAYDYVIQALVGIMMLAGDPDGPPVRAGYSVVDNTGGMMAAIGLLAKLNERKGGQIDVALYDTLLSQLNYLASSYLNAGKPPQRELNGAHSIFVPAQIFKTGDGYVSIFITHDNFWTIFANALGMPGWLEDPRFATMAARTENRAVVVDAIQAVLMTGTCAKWTELLQPLGIVIAAVGTLDQALESENVAARALVATLPTPAGPIRLVGNPIKIDGFTEAYNLPPRLGEHKAMLEQFDHEK